MGKRVAPNLLESPIHKAPKLTLGLNFGDVHKEAREIIDIDPLC